MNSLAFVAAFALIAFANAGVIDPITRTTFVGADSSVVHPIVPGTKFIGAETTPFVGAPVVPAFETPLVTRTVLPGPIVPGPVVSGPVVSAPVVSAPLTRYAGPVVSDVSGPFVAPGITRTVVGPTVVDPVARVAPFYGTQGLYL